MSESFLTNFMADLPHQGGYVCAQNQLGKKVPLANTTCLIEECQNIADISFLTMASRAHTKSNFSRTPAMFKEPLKLNSL